MADKKYNFFESYHRALSRVSDERYGRVVRAMSGFVFMDEDPSFDDDGDWMVWELIKPIIERGQVVSEARANAGSIGGESGKGISRNAGNNHASKANQKQTKANQKQIKSGKGIGKGDGEGIGDGIFSLEEKGKKEFNFVSPDFVQIFEKWLEYKRGRGEDYTPTQAEAFYNRLLQLSGGYPTTARQIVEQAMSGNYPTIVQLNPNSNYADNNANHRTPAENIRAAQEQHLRDLAEFIGAAKASGR